ncbi:VOC family protein [Exiguobacterium artemiae]|uniref:VOC family protein n=1 Tax=Exiguobacterium artemiae TaxID=340145 RepID=UPI002964436C|nr:VOC family protein [Exiguobacterium sibiricum]MDW2887127.1 VOC family protein [Exiguobacterium sibiricum]
MKITAATLWTNDVKLMQDFYTETLGFPLVEETATAFTMQIGTSQLRFELDTTEQPKQYHFAFNVPGDSFRLAKDWLQHRVPLLIEDGKDEIYFENINAHSVYFYDPDENVVELIARHDVNPAKSLETFTVNDILDIGEMNVTTPDVTGVGASFAELGVFHRYHQPINVDFLNFLGAPEDGTHLLLGREDRTWLFSPKSAITSPLVLELDGELRVRIDTDGVLHHDN